MPNKNPPADELIRTAYARETRDTAVLYEGMSLADLAHVVALVESEIIPKDAGGELLHVLLNMHPSRPLDFSVDPAQGDLYTNREAYIGMFTPTVGWLSTGRARREATTVGYRIAVRSRLLWLSRALEFWIGTCLDRAEEHRVTLFPDYTYLHPAQPTTFGHYLLTFVYPALRDLDRLRGAFERTNVSPAGSGSVNGSRLPLDRENLAALLGFESTVTHTRDAMWQADGPIEISALVTSILINVSRWAEDLQIFTTTEFDLVALDVSHTRSSVIMPQKQNPYSLAYLRGIAGESIGTLTSMAATERTPSGQIDNRMFAYGDVPRSLDTATAAMKLAAAVASGFTVKKDVAERRTREQFMGATDLADVILSECGIDYKRAHRIVAEAVRKARAEGHATLSPELLDAAAQEVVKKKLGLSNEVVRGALDPDAIVATRTGTGGAAESSVAQMIEEARARVEEHATWRKEARTAIDRAEARLVAEAESMRREPERKKREPEDWEKEFEGLPKMPEWRRRRW